MKSTPQHIALRNPQRNPQRHPTMPETVPVRARRARAVRHGRVLVAGALLSLVALAGRPARAAAPPDPLDERISVALQDAKASDVLGTFAKLTGAPFVVAPEVNDRSVTITVRGVRVATALTAVCESIGASWERTGDPPSVHVVATGPGPSAAPATPAKSSGPSPLDPPISLDLKDAAARDVFKSFGQILASAVDVDAAVTGTVTIHLRAAPVRDALDAVCRELGCTWKLEAVSGKATLQVRKAGGA